MKRYYFPALVIPLVIAAIFAAGGLEFVEHKLGDLRFSLVTADAEPGVVVAAIDAKSLRVLDVWPWPRGYHATVVENLLAAGAERVAFDVDFSSNQDADEDREFESTLRATKGKVILPVFQQWEQDVVHGGRLIMAQPMARFRRHAELGTINIRPDPDGVTRSYLGGVRLAEGWVPSLAPALAGLYDDVRPKFQVDYGFSVSSIPRISYVDVLTGAFEPELVRGKAVIIGATAVELGDYQAVPRYGTLPGCVVQALAYESLTQGRTLRRSSLTLAVVVVFMIGLIVGPKFETLTWRKGLMMVIVLSSVFFAVSVIVQRVEPLLVDISPWLATLVGCYGFGLARRIDQQTLRLLLQGKQIRSTEILMHHVVENSFDAVLTLRHDGTVETFNRAAEMMFGYGKTQAIGRNIRELVRIGANGSESSDAIDSFTTPTETTAWRSTGSGFPVEMAISSMVTEGVHRRVAFLRDITDRKAQQELLRHQATHDSLTDLPNRYLLEERVEQALRRAEDEGGPVSFLLLDLDRFKEVNDTLGHHTGDLLLQQIADRLHRPLRHGDTIARLGGDEFAVLLPGANAEQAKTVARELIRTLADPFAVEGLTLQVDTAIGIALYPEHGDDPQKLFQKSDVAMYSAKRGRAGIAVYDPEQDSGSMRQLTLTTELRHAIENESLELYYQPKISARDNRPNGVEALLRWNHPELGFIRPDEFVALAENTGLIKPLTRWVMRTAMKQAAAWQEAGIDLQMSINVSARNLLEEELPRSLHRLLDETQLAPEKLILEITENVIMEDPERALEVITDLATMGVTISIDDFGTGYSSLGYLRRLPANEIKIDRTFIMEMDKNPDDATIVRSTIELAHNLGRRVVAEGVENDVVWAELRKQGCDVGQGYFFCKPIPARELETWIEEWDTEEVAAG